MATAIVQDPAPPRNGETLLIHSSRIESLADALEAIRATPDGWRSPYLVGALMGVASSVCTLAAPRWSEAPVSLYEPPPAEPEPDRPSDDDLRWAAEHLTPARPRDAESLLRWLADQMEAIGLEPIVHAGSVDLEFAGRDYTLSLEDMTAFFARMEVLAAEHERDHLMASGLPG